MTDYKQKYLKYKHKLAELKKEQRGGMIAIPIPITIPQNIQPSFDSGNSNDPKVKRHLALLEFWNLKGASGPNPSFEILQLVYDENVVMRIANGPAVKGLKVNFEEMKKMYTACPNVKIVKQDIQFGSGDWTAASYIMQGTFTGPMAGDMIGQPGTMVQPTGKSFNINSCSLLEWKNDKVIQEVIFWDVAEFKKQLGIN